MQPSEFKKFHLEIYNIKKYKKSNISIIFIERKRYVILPPTFEQHVQNLSLLTSGSSLACSARGKSVQACCTSIPHSSFSKQCEK